jgi:predicted transglutaminase-like cysteine proteinase
MRFVRFKLVLLVLLACISLSSPAFAADDAKIFGYNESFSSNLRPFPKWTGMLKRNQSDKNGQKGCTATKFEKCDLKEWESFLQKNKTKSFEQKLKSVNNEMNKSTYILDIINWGIEDYWETPLQFFIRDGDCEDFAIAKYMSLKRLGVPEEKMRIVVLQDLNLNVVHAVLAVYNNDKAYILDNQIKQVYPHQKILHYQPVYSINEQGWWRHTI